MTRAVALLALVLIVGPPASAREITIGSKLFTESVVLGELLTQLARSAGAAAIHRRQLGGTQVLFSALEKGEIDAYPEYTGTLLQEILSRSGARSVEELKPILAERGMALSKPLGLNNTYALGVKEERAAALGLRTISDLRSHPELRFGFSNEFMDRGDGWPSLRRRYALPHQNVTGLEHELAYRGLEDGSIDVTDAYSTDAEILYYGLRTLEDDLQHFPAYHAVILYRTDLATRAPEVVASFRRIEGRIPDDRMVALNKRAKIDREPESRIASEFLAEELGIETEARVETAGARLLRTTLEHLTLVAISLGAAVCLAIPLGILAFRSQRAAPTILGAVGIVQTIPSLALLVFMIPLLGIGTAPAIMALFLYSLLPIVRNTYAGLHDIPPQIRESAEALGLSPTTRLRLVELPMASRAILAGVKTSAVINIGTATLGALIGAGGYGQPILTGIRLDDVGLILQGAIPAALLALGVQGGFDLADRFLVPRGLRIEGES